MLLLSATCVRSFLFKVVVVVVGLRRSALTMGGILVVCLAGASASMTVEANAWTTLSVAEVTRVYCLWSIGAIALLSASPPFCGSLWQFLLPWFEVCGQGFSPLGPVGCLALPGLRTDVHSLYVTFYNVAVPQLWPSKSCQILLSRHSAKCDLHFSAVRTKLQRFRNPNPQSSRFVSFVAGLSEIGPKEIRRLLARLAKSCLEADRISAKWKQQTPFWFMPLSETLRVSKCKETKPGIFPFNLARTSSFRSGKWKATFSQPSETALFRSVCFVLEINCRWSLAAWSADSKDPRSLRDLNSSVSWHAVNKWCKI